MPRVRIPEPAEFLKRFFEVVEFLLVLEPAIELPLKRNFRLYFFTVRQCKRLPRDLLGNGFTTARERNALRKARLKYRRRGKVRRTWSRWAVLGHESLVIVVTDSFHEWN